MKLTIIDNGYANHAALLKKHLDRRIPTEYTAGGMTITLAVNSLLGAADSYTVTKNGDAWQITGSDEGGLYYGIGKFLHTAKWTDTDFAPVAIDKTVTPACTFRAMYFAVHLYNWYANAPTEELSDYVEELLLWGYNAIVLIIPVLDIYTFEDRLYHNAVEKSRGIFKLAKRLGMKVGIIINPNQGLQSAPHELDADPSFDPIGNVRGNAGRNICPSKPGAVEYLKPIWDTMLRQYTDMGLDYLVTWPYDEGGCGCADCRPWGARAYCDLVIKLRDMTLGYYPNIKFIVSAWIFDKPDDQGEYAGLYKRLTGDMSWVDYIMVDAHAEYPRYPLEHPVIKPVVNFPEISMWKLYPWGGFGSNPLPARFHDIWNSAKKILKGGMPYSEGMYEDISKIQFAGYYWEPERAWEDIFAEYINYEFSDAVIEDCLKMVALIEKNHVTLGEQTGDPDCALSDEAAVLAEKIQASLGARA
ncbi:MAG: hypothetical protein IJY42_06025, partial [Clostridia bacterium]|nr:hypothetical protein [Clostridia bacterium]